MKFILLIVKAFKIQNELQLKYWLLNGIVFLHQVTSTWRMTVCKSRCVIFIGDKWYGIPTVTGIFSLMFTFSFLPLAKDCKLVFDMHAYVMYAEQFKCQVIVNFFFGGRRYPWNRRVLYWIKWERGLMRIQTPTCVLMPIWLCSVDSCMLC